MFSTRNLFKIAGKHLLIAGVSIFCASLLVLVISNQITKVAKKEATDRNLATLLSERATLLSSIKHESTVIGNNDKIIEAAFVPSNNILDFVSILESLALKHSIMQSFSFSSPVVEDAGAIFPVANIIYQNNLSANINVFVSYLKDFENLSYFTKIDTLNITSPNGWQDRSTISYGATVAGRSAQ